jgi:hypothetical protein
MGAKQGVPNLVSSNW